MDKKIEPLKRVLGFKESWITSSFNDIVSLSNKKFDPQNKAENKKCIELECLSKNSGEILKYLSSSTQKSIKNVFSKGSVLFGKLRPNLRKFALAEFDGVCSSEIWVMDGKQLSNTFLFYLIQTSRFYQVSTVASGSKMPRADWSYISAYPFSYPKSKDEQNKIAALFLLLDKNIGLLSEQYNLLLSYKKGILQQLFTQKIRLRNDRGNNFPDWKETRLNELLYEHKMRNYEMKFDKDNVLSVSGEMGIINQIEHMGRSYAGESVANYHIVHHGDIVYTKSPLKSNPFGIIKANKGKSGIVSTLYAVYSCKETACAEYLDYYFWLNDNTNRYLRPLVHKGAKNDMKINNQRVLIDQIMCPSKPEQEKIVRFLECIDKKIELSKKRLELTQTFKKGLLQQMFV